VAATPGGEAAQGERRQLTVMFCDLVGSTALGQRLDPEDLRDVLAAYHDASSAAVKRFEGHVAQHLGDGVLVYSGFPVAHEDDADRAVRAAPKSRRRSPHSMQSWSRFSRAKKSRESWSSMEPPVADRDGTRS